MSLAKAVANTTAALVLKAKSFADALEPGRQKDHVISSATLCAQSTSQLVACTKVLIIVMLPLVLFSVPP